MNVENPLGLFLLLPCLRIKINRKIKQPNSGRATSILNLQNSRFGFLHHAENHNQVRYLLKVKGLCNI